MTATNIFYNFVGFRYSPLLNSTKPDFNIVVNLLAKISQTHSMHTHTHTTESLIISRSAKHTPILTCTASEALLLATSEAMTLAIDAMYVFFLPKSISQAEQ